MTESAGSQIPTEYKAGVEKCLSKYKTYEVFLAKLNIDATAKLLPEWQDEMICPFDDKGDIRVPTLLIASVTFGKDRIMAWLMSYIVNVNSFFLGSNVERKMTPSQMEDASLVILQNYGNLFVSEIPVVFARIKGGKYGKAYGVIDGGMICNCFELYINDRNEERAEIFKRKERAKIEKRRAVDEKVKSISFDEFKNTLTYADLEMAGKTKGLEEFVKKFGFDIEK